MRALKILSSVVLVAAALAFGLVAAAIAAVVACVFLLLRRFGRPAARQRGIAPSTRPRSAPVGEAIDITATEVPADSTEPANRRLTHG